MGQSPHFLVSLSLSIIFLLSITTSARLKLNYYARVCPDVENIVRRAVEAKFRQTFATAPAAIRLFFHDCFVSGCDASIIVASTSGNNAEKDHPDNLSLAGDGFDTVIKAKEAVDRAATCKNKVSCADILALATRDAIVLSGGPKYKVELGRLDGLKSMAQSVNLPQPDFNLTQLNAMFALKGLSQEDMIALSACHTIGFSHCNQFSNRIYNFNRQNPIDPTLNPHYVAQLREMCPRKVDPAIVVNLDPTTPTTFDNAYFKNLVQGMGLFSSDQVLFTDTRSRSTVTTWASNNATLFNSAFITAITKLGRVGIKTKNSGNIRFDCAKFN